MTSLFVILMFSLVLAGCNSPVSDRTDIYGNLIFQDPDSLLQTVTSEDTAGMSEGERHLHNLMYTAAMYRTGMYMKDTVVISDCEHYYDNQGDEYHASLSKLFHAENAYNQFDYYKAIDKLKDAYRLSEHINNDALKCEIFTLLYHINNETGCYARADSACRNAAAYALSAGIVSQIASSNNDMSSMLIDRGRLDEAREIIDRNSVTAAVTDKRISSEYYRIKGVYLMARDSIDEAHSMLKKAERIMPTAETFYNMAEMYLKTGDADSCINYCHFATTADRRGYVSIRAYGIIVENFSSRMGNNTLIRICTELNKLHLKRAEGTDVIKIDAMQSAFYEDGIHRGLLWILIIVALSIVLLLGYLFKRNNIPARDNSGDMRFMNENIVYELHKLCQQGRSPSQEQWIALHNAANRHIPFFLARLHKINDLSARDINICLLTRLHFTPSETAVLSGMSPQSVTNCRARLLAKIFGEKGGAADFDRRIKDMGV